MGYYPRRVYIFPRRVQEDDAAANGWPLNTTDLSRSYDDQAQYRYSDYPESYPDQSGGLLGMLLRGMQQARPSSGTDERPPSEPENSDIRKLTRVYATEPSQDAISSSDPFDSRSNAPYNFQDNEWINAPRQARPGDHTTQPGFLPADSPTNPYDAIAKLKETLDRIPQPFSNSIDATSPPLTAGGAFGDKLGQGKSHGYAWQAASSLDSVVPRGMGGVLARPQVGAITNRGMPLQADQSIAKQGVGGSVANAEAPAARFVSRYWNLPPELQDAAALGAPRNSVSPHSTRSAEVGPLPTSAKSALPWIAAAPEIQAGLDVIEAARKKIYRGPLPKGVDLLDWSAKPPLKKPYGSHGGLGRGGPPRKGIEGDPDDLCNDMYIKEQNRCFERYDNEEYADVSHFNGCLKRATDRWDLCNRTGKPPIEPKEWGPDDEEIFDRDFRIR